MIDLIFSWVHSWQWGNVPSWASAGSLLLAFVIFGRDRRERVRGQIEGLGVWATVTVIDDENKGKKFSSAQPTFHLKNTSALPVRVNSIRYRYFNQFTQTVVPSRVGQEPAGEKSRTLVFARLRTVPLENFIVEPETQIELGKPQVFPWHFAEDEVVVQDARGIRKIVQAGVLTVKVVSVIATDNAGRRWKIRPSSAKFPKRVRRYGFYLGLIFADAPVSHDLHTDGSLRFARVATVIRVVVSSVVGVIISPIVLLAIAFKKRKG